MNNHVFSCADIPYEKVATHIPWVMNSLYNFENISYLVSLEEIRDAFRVQQCQSKQWLLNNIVSPSINLNSKILVVGSWLGFTSYCLHKLGFINVTETDLDPKYQMLSEIINNQFKNFKHYSEDINNISVDEYDVIICTSCEHIEDNSWFDRIQPKTKLFLQSTNLVLPDHPNTVNSAEEFSEKYPLNLSYMGTMKYHKSFFRYMIIGEK